MYEFRCRVGFQARLPCGVKVQLSRDYSSKPKMDWSWICQLPAAPENCYVVYPRSIICVANLISSYSILTRFVVPSDKASMSPQWADEPHSLISTDPFSRDVRWSFHYESLRHSKSPCSPLTRHTMWQRKWRLPIMAYSEG